MKTCPQCGNTYTDQNLYFCLQDGAALYPADSEAPPTAVIDQNRQSTIRVHGPPPMPHPLQPQVSSRRNSPRWLLLLFVLLVLSVLGGGLAFLILSKGGSSSSPEITEATPSPQVTDELIPQSAVVVAIPEADQFYIGKNLVEKAEIPDQVRHLLKDTLPEEQVVYVKAMCHVPYGVVASVIDALREAGFQRIGLLADKETDRSTTTVRKDRGASELADVRPRDTSASTARNSELLLITVESKTFVRLNDSRLSLSTLKTRLQSVLASRSDKAVFVKAPVAMNYCDVIGVIDVAKAAGAQPIGLQVDD